MENSDKPGKIDPDMETKEPVKILLADDDKDDQEFFSEALDTAKIPSELTTVDNGQELIEHLKDPSEPNPDIIFIDINMPVKGGKEALAEIKSDDVLKEIPTVILSTSDHPNDIEETLNIGANLYVRKPNSLFSLVNILKKVFNLHWAKTLLNPVKKVFFISEKNIAENEN
ncbi:MAG: response regulator [Bacteroidota bacterium]